MEAENMEEDEWVSMVMVWGIVAMLDLKWDPATNDFQ